MIGLGAQDNFGAAQEFIADVPLDDVNMLWDPSFSTWQAFGVRINSQMMITDGSLDSATNLFYGFGPNEQSQILETIDTFG